MVSVLGVGDEWREYATFALWVVIRGLVFGVLWRLGVLDGGETTAIFLGANALDADDTARRIEFRRSAWR